MAAVSAEGSTVCVLMRRLNSSCSRSTALPLDRAGGPRRLPLARRQAREGEQPVDLPPESWTGEGGEILG
jgi:hypothetical protein